VLEGVTVELCIVIEVVGVCKEVAARTEDITAIYVWAWQTHLLWLGDLKAVFG
jgi:hypothetical protein